MFTSKTWPKSSLVVENTHQTLLTTYCFGVLLTYLLMTYYLSILLPQRYFREEKGYDFNACSENTVHLTPAKFKICAFSDVWKSQGRILHVNLREILPKSSRGKSSMVGGHIVWQRIQRIRFLQSLQGLFGSLGDGVWTGLEANIISCFQ